MLDHLRNSVSVNIDDLDILILDEADRLLDMGFKEEVSTHDCSGYGIGQ